MKRSEPPAKASLKPIVLAVALGVLLPIVGSATNALFTDDGLSLLGRGAAWARNHRLDWLVDRMELLKYSSPPSAVAAKDLTTLREVNGVLDQNDDQPISIVSPNVPSLSGEGEWTIARRVSDSPVVWVTGARTSVAYPSITTTFMLIDSNKLKARLYNGTEVPGGRSWVFGNHVADEDKNSLVAAINGGFRLSHRAGGYYAEDKTVMPLLSDKATIGIDFLGNFSIGIWDETPLFNEQSIGRWASLRQNLLPILIEGELNPALKRGYWGGSGRGEIFILRSAVCVRTDGKIVFAISGMTDAIELARAMQLAECKTAMQLDQNASYPRGLTYENGIPARIDKRMAGKDDEYLRHSLRDFFAFFEK